MRDKVNEELYEAYGISSAPEWELIHEPRTYLVRVTVEGHTAEAEVSRLLTAVQDVARAISEAIDEIEETRAWKAWQDDIKELL